MISPAFNQISSAMAPLRPAQGAVRRLNNTASAAADERAAIMARMEELQAQQAEISRAIAAEQEAALQSAPPVMGRPNLDPRRALAIGGIGLLGQLFGARPQIVNPAIQNALAADMARAQAEQESLFQQAMAKMQSERSRAEARLQGMTREFSRLGSQASGLGDLLPEIYRAERESAREAAGIAREGIRQGGMDRRASQTNQTRMDIADKLGIVYRAMIEAGIPEEEAREAIMADYKKRIAQAELTRERTATEEQMRPIKIKQGEANVRRIQAQTSHTQALTRFLPQRMDNERMRVEQGWAGVMQRGQNFSQDDIIAQERFIRDDIQAANKGIAGLQKERRESARRQMEIRSLYPEGSDERIAADRELADIDTQIKGLQQVVAQANARLKELRSNRPADLIGPVNPNAPLNPMQADPSLRGRIGR